MTARGALRALGSTVLISGLLTHSAAAQITTGTVSGSVRDGQGAVVPGATVTLVSAARGTTMDTATNAQGDFVFPNVTPGTYLVRVSLQGFKAVERPDLVVSPGDRGCCRR